MLILKAFSYPALCSDWYPMLLFESSQSSVFWNVLSYSVIRAYSVCDFENCTTLFHYFSLLCYLELRSTVACNNSFVYTSGHCRRWRSRMEVKIMAGSLFVHCKIAYIYLVTAEKWLVISLPNFVMIRMTHLPISCKIFSWIRTTKLKIHAMEFCDFIKDSVSPSGLFVPCSLTVTITWRPRLTAHCPIRERH